jgi:hypothetical protein
VLHKQYHISELIFLNLLLQISSLHIFIANYPLCYIWDTAPVHLDSTGIIQLLDFRTLSIVRYSRNQKTQRFGNWICFRPQVRGETPTLLGPLERANLKRLRRETYPVSETLFFFLVSRIPDDGQSPKTQQFPCSLFLLTRSSLQTPIFHYTIPLVQFTWKIKQGYLILTACRGSRSNHIK